MVVKAVSTKQLIIEYGNYALMTNIAVGTSALAYVAYTGNQPAAGTIIGAMLGASAAPAAILSLRSFSRLWALTDGPRKLAPVHVGVTETNFDGPGTPAREITINGMRTFFSAVRRSFRDFEGAGFDPKLRDDVKNFTIKYKEQRRKLIYWDVEVLPRSDRAPVRVRLYEDLADEIIWKIWRQQMRGNPHPLSRDKLLSLAYSCRGGRRLFTEEYLAFLDVAQKFCLINGARRQGTSGKLNGDPTWCRAQLRITPTPPEANPPHGASQK